MVEVTLSEHYYTYVCQKRDQVASARHTNAKQRAGRTGMIQFNSIQFKALFILKRTVPCLSCLKKGDLGYWIISNNLHQIVLFSYSSKRVAATLSR